MKNFIVVVDMQGDFVMADGALPVPGAESLNMPMQAWLAALDPARTAGLLFTFDTHEPASFARSPEAEQFPLHCVKNTPGWESVLDLAAIDPAIPLWRLEKSVFDMWSEAALHVEDARGGGASIDRDAFFQTLAAQGVERVTVVGVAADYCVRWAIEGLLERGFAVDVPPHLTRGINRSIEAVVADCLAGRPVRVALPA